MWPLARRSVFCLHQQWKTCNSFWQMSAGRHLLPEGWHPLRGSDTYAQSCQDLPVIGVIILEQCGCHRNLQLNVFFCLYTKCVFDLTRCTEHWVRHRTMRKKMVKKWVENDKNKLLMNGKCMLSIFHIHLPPFSVPFYLRHVSLRSPLQISSVSSNISAEAHRAHDWRLS